MSSLFFFFFFQAEDGIRDATVTGVQTCALPISSALLKSKVLYIYVANYEERHRKSYNAEQFLPHIEIRKKSRQRRGKNVIHQRPTVNPQPSLPEIEPLGQRYREAHRHGCRGGID